MKKKTVSAKSSSLPADFSVTDAPEIKTPAIKTPVIETSDATNAEEAPLPVPEIDDDAQLKIDEVQMKSEELPETEKKGKLLLVIGSVIGLLVIASAAAFSYLYFKKPAPKPAEVVTATTPTPQISATPTTPTLTKSDFNFEVLNASGVSGQAGKIKTTVEGVGYTVSSVGNANSIETGTKLLLNARLVSQKDLLVTDLLKIIPNLTYYGEFADATATARIIVGK